MAYAAILGLVTGSLTAFVNYKLLSITVRKCFGKRNILALQIMLFRYLLYMIMAYVCVRMGDKAVIMYAAGVLCLLPAIIITNGIGGLRKQ